MNVRRNCKVFSFFVKQAAINCFTLVHTHLCACMHMSTMHVPCTCTLMHIWSCVCTHAWHACVYMYATSAHQLIPRPPVYYFIYVNTSIDMNAFVHFWMCLYLKEMYIHSACRFIKLCYGIFPFNSFTFFPYQCHRWFQGETSAS